MNQKLDDIVSRLKKANNSLHTALETSPRSAVVIAGIIKNFEFNFELTWKSMKRLLQEHGIEATSPRQVFASAYQLKFISEDRKWIQMLDDRNLTVHTYDEEFAKAMLKRIEEIYLKIFDDVLKVLESQETLP